MERRFVVFLVLTVLLWSGFIALRLYLVPPPPPVAKQPAADPKAPAAKPEPQAKAPQPESPKTPEAEPKPPQIAAAPAPSAPRKRFVLGSADPTSGYTALYYFDNRGAALECAELNGYKSVEDFSGYLGRLDLTEAIGGGAEVNIVGPGTPAALATAKGQASPGLAAGDVIQKINGQSVADGVALQNFLRTKTRPGDRITLSITRKGADQTLEFTANLTRRPLEVVGEPRTLPVPGGGVKLLSSDPKSLLLTFDSLSTAAIRSGDEEITGLPSLHNSNWQVEQQGEGFLEFSFTLDEAALAAARIEKAGPLKVIKRYSLTKAQKPGDMAYHVDMQIAVHNLGQQPLSMLYRLGGPTALPLEGWWYSTKLNPNWGGAGARDVVWKQAGHSHQLIGNPKIVSDAKTALKNEELPGSPLLLGDQAAPLEYAGVDTQFFASALKPQPIEKDQLIRFRSAVALPVQDVTAIPKPRLRTADVSVRLITSKVEINPQSALKHDYRVFLGPKDPRVLSAYGLEPLIEYGWQIFAVPARLLRGVLNGLYWLTGLIGIPNYGIAIILLTVIVRTCMIPVSLKQARSAAKMQELAPEIQKIKDKFPDDAMKQHQAVQELYKKHDFNMFGGCLPVFIQLPIFIGLYRCLSVDIDLRDASLIPGIDWASNLAGPDKLFRWDSWMPAFLSDEASGYLGPFFNVFPLITVALFLVQQKMFTPPATDEQTKMQQQMMTYMTVFMGFMFFKVPAGLCIYFITSSLWGICERKLLPKSQLKDSSSAGGGNGGGGGGGLLAKLTGKPASPNGSAKSGLAKSGPGKRPKQRR